MNNSIIRSFELAQRGRDKLAQVSTAQWYQRHARHSSDLTAYGEGSFLRLLFFFGGFVSDSH